MTQSTVPGLFIEGNLSKPDLPQECGDIGKEQRLRIVVPSANTMMTMGQAFLRITGEGRPEEKRKSYRGFGVQTEGHIFLNAHGVKDDCKINSPEADSKMTLQSTGHVIIQSGADGVYLGAKTNALVGSGGNTLIGGRGGVVLMGGLGVGDPVCQASDGLEPPLPPNLNDTVMSLDRIGKFWGAIDAFVGAYGINLDKIDAQFGPEAETGGGGKWAASVFTSLPTWGSLSGILFNAAGLLDSDPFGGTVIHGNSGVVVGAVGSAAIYAGTGVGIASPLSVGLTAPYVAVGGMDIDVRASRNASITSLKTTSVLASETVQVASRAGEVSVLGRDVQIGQLADGIKNQKATETAFISATESVDVVGLKRAMLRSEDKLCLNAGDVLAFAKQGMSLRAEKKLHASAGEFQINIDNRSLTLGIGSPLPDAPVVPRNRRKAKKYERELEAYENKLQAAREKRDACIVVKKGRIEIQVKGSKLVADGSSWKINGGQIVVKS